MVCSDAPCGRRCSVFRGAALILTWLLLALAPPLSAQSPVAAGPSSAETADSGADAKLRALLDVIEDDQARSELIDRLSALSGTDEQAAEPAPPTTSLARQIAELTRKAAEDASALLGRIWRDVRGLRETIGTGVDFGRLFASHAGLIGVIATTFAVLLSLRLLRRPLFAHLTERARESRVVGAILWLFGTVLIDTLVVLMAFACGYGLALGIFGHLGKVGVDQSLFLNGFLLVELTKAVLRGLISPRSEALRFLPIGDRTAGFAYSRSSAIASTVGYGALVAAPLMTGWISPASGRAVALLAMSIALVLALLGIRKLKALLDDEATPQAQENDATGNALAVLHHIWPWLAAAYAIGVFLIAVSRPAEALPFVLTATLRSAVALAIGIGVVVLTGRALKGGITLPSSLRSTLPQLGGRLNRLVPKLLWILRLLVMIAVALAVIDAFGLVDVGGWLGTENGQATIGAVATAALIVALAYLIWLLSMSWIEFRLSGHRSHFAGARERTLLSLFGNVITIALATITVMLVLSELGINIGPLLAGAGVIGLAVGFGAQKLVQDIITGVFIQFENAINTGDVVTVAGTTGVVERLSVRAIGVRDLSGTYHLIPFSSVDQVSNFNRGFAYHVADIGIAYKESVADAKEAMQAAFDRLKEGELAGRLLGDLEMFGVNALGDSAVVVRARLRTAPGEQWAVGRAYNELVKEVFDERGIDIPFPHMTVYMGTEKGGKTQLDGLLHASR